MCYQAAKSSLLLEKVQGIKWAWWGNTFWESLREGKKVVKVSKMDKDVKDEATLSFSQ